jgi:hypothetical protein
MTNLSSLSFETVSLDVFQVGVISNQLLGNLSALFESLGGTNLLVVSLASGDDLVGTLDSALELLDGLLGLDALSLLNVDTMVLAEGDWVFSALVVIVVLANRDVSSLTFEFLYGN